MKVTFKPDISEWKHSCTCGQCTSKMDIVGDDLLYKLAKRTGWDGEDGGSYSYNEHCYYVVCPVCAYEIEVNSVATRMPFLLRKTVEDRCKKEKSK